MSVTMSRSGHLRLPRKRRGRSTVHSLNQALRASADQEEVQDGVSTRGEQRFLGASRREDTRAKELR